MVRRDPPLVLLDSGAVIQLARGNGTLRRYLDRINAAGGEVRVPAVVLAETVRGHGPRDAPVNLVLHRLAPHPSADEELARLAGSLLARSGSRNTIDALVAAEAVRRSPAVLVTGDPTDMLQLLSGQPGVMVRALDGD